MEKSGISIIARPNLHIRVTADNVLIASDSEHHHDDESGEIVHLCELGSGKLFRNVRFPEPVDPDNVSAEVKNGMLTLRAPRMPAKSVEVRKR